MTRKKTLDEFVNGLHGSTTLLARGRALVSGREVEAILVRNAYEQELVWGMFGHDRGKFKGYLANNAATGRVRFESETHTVEYSPPFGDFDENDPILPMNWPSQDHLSELVKAAIEQQKKGK